MGNRGTVPWAATSVPEIRRQWCAALDSVSAQHAEGLKPQTGPSAGSRRLARMQAKLGETLSEMTAETDALRAAQMYWVSRDMTTTVVEAAATLPEWTPAVAAPAPSGLLCWARPAGTCRFAQGWGASTEVPFDAMWWFTRDDGVMQLTPSTRLVKNRDLLAPFNVSSPLWSAETVLVDPRTIRTEESRGTTQAQQFVAILGAAWLLMGQRNFSETRTVPGTVSDKPAPGTRAPRPPQTVTLIDMRRPVSSREKPDGQGGEHAYDHRFWVGRALARPAVRAEQLPAQTALHRGVHQRPRRHAAQGARQGAGPTPLSTPRTSAPHLFRCPRRRDPFTTPIPLSPAA